MNCVNVFAITFTTVRVVGHSQSNSRVQIYSNNTKTIFMVHIILIINYAGGSGQYRAGSVTSSPETPRASSSVVTRTARSSSGSPSAMPSPCWPAWTPPDTSPPMTSGTWLQNYLLSPPFKEKVIKTLIGKILSRFVTTFPSDDNDSEMGSDDWPPFRKVGNFDPFTDDPR